MNKEKHTYLKNEIVTWLAKEMDEIQAGRCTSTIEV